MLTIAPRKAMTQPTADTDCGLCCPKCGGEFRVLWRRNFLDKFRRRIECTGCGHRDFSIETLESAVSRQCDISNQS